MPKIPYRVHPETAVLTRGFDPELSVCSARPPVYRTSTFVFPSPEAAERAFAIVLGRERAQGREGLAPPVEKIAAMKRGTVGCLIEAVLP